MAGITRALISVSDKTGVVDIAKGLEALGVEILSTGGTAKALRDAGLKVTDVAAYTGSPEILDGRVKTLHPKIHGGLLGRRSVPTHVEQMTQHGIGPIDVVVVNLYPFEAKVRTAAALSAVFILVNSVAGLLGNLSATKLFPSFGALPIAAALVGGALGSWLGSQRFPRPSSSACSLSSSPSPASSSSCSDLISSREVLLPREVFIASESLA